MQKLNLANRSHAFSGHSDWLSDGHTISKHQKDPVKLLEERMCPVLLGMLEIKM